MADKASLKPASSGGMKHRRKKHSSRKKKKNQLSKLEMLFHASLISCFAHAIKNSKQKRLSSPLQVHILMHTQPPSAARAAGSLHGAAIISSHKIPTET